MIIKWVEFKNFRNLDSGYYFHSSLNFIVGKNGAGKTNILEGVKLAFASIVGDYFKISKTDFKDDNDANPFTIKVALNYGDIPTLNIDVTSECGFILIVSKSASGRYVRDIRLLNGSRFDLGILRADPKLPDVCSLPLDRSQNLYTDGLDIDDAVTKSDEYNRLREESKEIVKNEIKSQIIEFKNFAKEFNNKLDIDIADPKMDSAKAYVVSGVGEHNTKVGSGYRSIGTVLLHATSTKPNTILLIDEIENNLHPALIRSLIRWLRKNRDVFVLASTHSSVVVNEAEMAELVDIGKADFLSIASDNKRKLETFLHPGRAEILFADNVVLVEGYTEEMLLKNFLRTKNYNWTIVNVVGVMFEPYIELCCLLDKKVIVISDDDRVLSSKGDAPSTRFNNLSVLCKGKGIRLIAVENTLESDLYKNGYIDPLNPDIEPHKVFSSYWVAKQGKKTSIALRMIADGKDLSDWHVIKELEDEIRNH